MIGFTASTPDATYKGEGEQRTMATFAPDDDMIVW